MLFPRLGCLVTTFSGASRLVLSGAPSLPSSSQGLTNATRRTNLFRHNLRGFCIISEDAEEIEDIPVPKIIPKRTLVEILKSSSGDVAPTRDLAVAIQPGRAMDSPAMAEMAHVSSIDKEEKFFVMDTSGEVHQKKIFHMSFVAAAEDENVLFSPKELLAIKTVAKAQAEAAGGRIEEIWEKYRHNTSTARDKAQVTAAEVAEYIWGKSDPVTSYTAHLLLRKGFCHFKMRVAALGYDCRLPEEVSFRKNQVDQINALLGPDSTQRREVAVVLIARRLLARNRAKEEKKNARLGRRTRTPSRARAGGRGSGRDSRREVREKKDQYGRFVTEFAYERLASSEFAKSVPEIPWDPSGPDVKAAIGALRAYAAAPRTEVFEDVYESFLEHVLNPLGYRGRGVDAFQLLVDIGEEKEVTNLNLWSYPFSFDYPDEIVTAAATIIDKGEESFDPDKDRRVSMDNLPAYTIDDQYTREVDDAVSVSDDGKTVYIHIADPTRLISPGSELEVWSRTSASTLYLPEATVPMVPNQLSHGPMSILEDQENRCLTFAVELNDDGSVNEYDIFPSKVGNVRRLTYAEADQFIIAGRTYYKDQKKGRGTDSNGAGDMTLGGDVDALTKLYEIATKRDKWRAMNGAININFPRPEMKVLNDGEEIVFAIDDDSDFKSRMLVKEMMVLSGEVAAMYAEKANLSVPYRSQDAPDLSEIDLSVPRSGNIHPILEAFRTVRVMRSARVISQPSPHAGLGLNSYLRVSSPIRRYQDLLTHYQIKSTLRGEDPTFSAEFVEKMNARSEQITSIKTHVQSTSNRFWLLQFLKRRCESRRDKQDKYNAVVLETYMDERGTPIAQVMLENWALRSRVKTTPDVVPGDVMKVELQKINPVDGFTLMRRVD